MGYIWTFSLLFCRLLVLFVLNLQGSNIISLLLRLLTSSNPFVARQCYFLHETKQMVYMKYEELSETLERVSAIKVIYFKIYIWKWFFSGFIKKWNWNSRIYVIKESSCNLRLKRVVITYVATIVKVFYVSSKVYDRRQKPVSSSKTSRKSSNLAAPPGFCRLAHCSSQSLRVYFFISGWKYSKLISILISFDVGGHRIGN